MRFEPQPHAGVAMRRIDICVVRVDESDGNRDGQSPIGLVVYRLFTKPLIPDDAPVHDGHDAPVAVRKALLKYAGLALKPRKAVEVVRRRAANRAAPAQQRDGNARLSLEAQETEPAEVDGSERDPSQQLLSDGQQRRPAKRPDDIAQKSAPHAMHPASIRTGGMCRYRAAWRFDSITRNARSTCSGGKPRASATAAGGTP